MLLTTTPEMLLKYKLLINITTQTKEQENTVFKLYIFSYIVFVGS